MGCQQHGHHPYGYGHPCRWDSAQHSHTMLVEAHQRRKRLKLI
jgi:hypothetical protein